MRKNTKIRIKKIIKAKKHNFTNVKKHKIEKVKRLTKTY